MRGRRIPQETALPSLYKRFCFCGTSEFCVTGCTGLWLNHHRSFSRLGGGALCYSSCVQSRCELSTDKWRGKW